MLDTALRWLQLGIIPVPLKYRSKSPVTYWRKLQHHAPPPTVVRRWDWNGRNLGLMCGPISGGLVVLDFDRPLGYHKWAAHNPKLATTYTVRTARGRHVYLRMDELPANTLRMGCNGEVKASGYVVAPPSVHPSGMVYTALDADAPILRVRNLAEVCVQVYQPARMAYRSPLRSGTPTDSTRSLVRSIKNALPITTYLDRVTTLVPSSSCGTWWMCCCPFHDDRNPSMWVNARTNKCRCFVPGCAGAQHVHDVIEVHARLCSISNSEAIFDLAAELQL